MTKRKSLIVVAVVLVLAVAWYLFRPDLLFINARVNERFPEGQQSQQVVLASGMFHGVAHGGKGTATVHRLADGKRMLRFTNFETSNGPALHVYLIAARDAGDSDTVKRVKSIDLGELKGNIGAQNYELPAEVDLARFQAVTIWCQRFSVNFATAPLTVQ